jgi:hypothetical protein
MAASPTKKKSPRHHEGRREQSNLNETILPSGPLARAASASETARKTVLDARLALRSGKLQEASTLLENAARSCHQATRAAVAAGALEPSPLVASGARFAPDLHQLDTAKNRRLLEALDLAIEAAAAVDLERGHHPDDGLSGVLAGIADGVRAEVLGAPGLGLE